MAGERGNHTLQATAVINEAFLRLIDWKNVRWENRAHFMGVVAGLMRRVLVDYARSRGYQKRDAGLQVTLDDGLATSKPKSVEVLDLDHALSRLEQMDPRKAKMVELRFFAGLTVEETAEALKISPNTVLNDWNFTKTWLFRQMNHRKGPRQ
jgi:RNA polymerase sigma factor (TIGR02999 family)